MPAGCSGATRATGVAGKKKNAGSRAGGSPQPLPMGGTRGDTWGHLGTFGDTQGPPRHVPHGDTATRPPWARGPGVTTLTLSSFFFWFPLFFALLLLLLPPFFSFFFTFCLAFYLIFLFNSLTFLTFPPLSPPFKYTFSSLFIHRFSFFPF